MRLAFLEISWTSSRTARAQSGQVFAVPLLSSCRVYAALKYIRTINSYTYIIKFILDSATKWRKANAIIFVSRQRVKIMPEKLDTTRLSALKHYYGSDYFPLRSRDGKWSPWNRSTARTPVMKAITRVAHDIVSVICIGTQNTKVFFSSFLQVRAVMG